MSQVLLVHSARAPGEPALTRQTRRSPNICLAGTPQGRRTMVTESTSDLRAFQDLESNVRYYCRRFPALFTRAKNALVYDEAGRSYIDFSPVLGRSTMGTTTRRSSVPSRIIFCRTG